MRYKITIEYDGTNYVGWQAQKNLPGLSIEDILLTAIFKMTGQNVSLNCAGRTDAGVHAIAQVADFAIEKEFEPFRMMMGINNYLVESNINIVACEIVDDNFHSRFDAKMRFYQYRILNRRIKSPLRQNRVFHVPASLDISLMQEAAQFLVGKEYDFSAFRDSSCQANSAMRTVDKIEITRQNDEVIIDVVARSFLHHMVRNIVGTLVLAGLEKIAPIDMKSILQSKDRTNSGANAPACGLYFLGAKY